MPQVPYDPVQQVMPTGRLAGQQIQASPADFGAQVGQTLSQGSNELMQQADLRQQLNNETTVNDTINNKFFPAFQDAYQKYYALQGKDAVDQLPVYQQHMQDLRQQYRESLGNQMQQRLFDQEVDRRIQFEIAGMSRYRDQQNKIYQAQTFQGTINRLISAAADKWNDPQAIQNAVRSIGEATFNFSRQTGASPEYSDNQLSGYLNKLFGTVIQRRLAAGDVTGAQRLYDEGSNRELITGEGAAKLQERLKPYQESQQAASAFSVATGGPIATRIAQTAQSAGVDPGVALGIWSAEGGVTNPETRNPKSSATGIFQFLDSTWANAGGVPENRMDVNEQISKGIQSIRQNTDQLRKDLGRSPLPWEIYLTHQQGVKGAESLLRADPNAKAADIVGEKAVTLNGGSTEITAGQFLATVAGMYRIHAGTYNADGVPSAQNYQRNYASGLQAVTDLAEKEHPEDPAAVERYRNYYIQQAGQTLEAARMTDRANRETLRQGLISPNGAKSWSEFLSDPKRAQAYTDSVREDPGLSGRVDSVISANALGTWDPPANERTNDLRDELRGMQTTDPIRFSALDLDRFYGSMPIQDLNDLLQAQKSIRYHDTLVAEKNAALVHALRVARPDFIEAAGLPGSPYRGADPDSESSEAAAAYNLYAGRFGRAIDAWRQNNSGKIPSDADLRQIARGFLFTGDAGMVRADDTSSVQDRGEQADNNNGDSLGRWIAARLEARGLPATKSNIGEMKARLLTQDPDFMKRYESVNLMEPTHDAK